MSTTLQPISVKAGAQFFDTEEPAENRAIVGEAVGVFFLAEYAGIDPETGEELIYDLDGNIVVLNATNSVSERKVMGKPYPDLYGGIKNTFEYKNFGFV